MSGCAFIFASGSLIVFLFTVAQGQSTTKGFISINCGLPKDKEYNEAYSGLPYISDSEFIDTGESNVVSSEFYMTDTPRNYLRSFPNGIRNCYEIKLVVEGWTYLVRARFRYGNYDGKNKLPRFDLYLGINYWQIVSFKNANTTYNHEIVVAAVTNSISICLVNTDQGTPFISAIELRRLPNTLYPEATTSQSLRLLERTNLGGSLSRYPNDIYDRFWYADQDDIQSPVRTLTTSSSIRTSFFTEPSEVMQSLVYPQTATDLSFNVSVTPVGACPSTRAYFVFYLAELEKLLLNESRILRVYVDDEVISDDIQPEYLKTTTFEKSISFNEGQLRFSVVEAPASTKPPILNAFEIYTINDLTCQSETRSLDVEAMKDIKAFYKVQRNWSGDPCAPKAYIWDGLNCSYNGSNSPLVTSLNLSSSGLTGEISDSIANLSSLQYLDLSSNYLTGEIPDSFSRLTQLKVLNLANNSLIGSIPKVFLDMSNDGQLNLSTGGNPNLCSKPDYCQEESSKKNKKFLFIVVISCIIVSVVVVVVASVAVWRCKRKPNTDPVSTSRVESNHMGIDDRINQDKQLRDIEIVKINLGGQFTYEELERITKNFSEKIGEGGFGKVYRGKLDNGVQVAVKKLKITSTSLSRGVEGFHMEAKLLTRIHHKNLVSFIGYCDDDIDHLSLVYEYVEGGNLEENLSGKNKRNPLSWKDRLQIAREAAQGFEYLHKSCKPPIIHRDVKTSNILLTERNEARIADFGLSRIFQNEEFTHIVATFAGTPGYMDPGYLRTGQVKVECDVYSFGCVLMELITGLPVVVDGEETGGDIHISKWIEKRLLRGKITEIIDRRIQGECDENSASKFVKIAQECTNDELPRPDITKVVEDLKELYDAYLRSHTTRTPFYTPEQTTIFQQNRNYFA